MDYLAAVPALAGSLKTCLRVQIAHRTQRVLATNAYQSPAAIPGQRRTLADIVEQIKKAASIAALGLVKNSWLLRPNLIALHVLDPPSTWVALGIGYGVGIIHKLDHVEHVIAVEDVCIHFFPQSGTFCQTFLPDPFDVRAAA